MPELTLAPQLLCASSALQDGGLAVVFQVLEHGQAVPAFAIRHEGVVQGYLNRCAHVPAEMDWLPGRFWDAEQRYLICSMHGALYEPANGLCVSGPCRGSSLWSIRLGESGDQVCWYPSERFQPLP